MYKVTLEMWVPDYVAANRVIDDINCAHLCKYQDDDGVIVPDDDTPTGSGWSWVVEHADEIKEDDHA